MDQRRWQTSLPLCARRQPLDVAIIRSRHGAALCGGLRAVRHLLEFVEAAEALERISRHREASRFRASPDRCTCALWTPPQGRSAGNTRCPVQPRCWAGTVSTAGGLVFTGDDDGQPGPRSIRAPARTFGTSYTGHTLYASPITFQMNGRQYVTIAAETDIFTFALFQQSAK